MKGIGLGLGIFRGNTPFNEATVSWMSRINAVGGSVSDEDAVAVNNAGNALRLIGMTDANSRVNFFAGENLTAAMVPYFRGGGPDSDTNVNFVAGDYTRATGMTGNGASKYIRTGHIATGTVGGLTVYHRVSVSATFVMIGCRSASDIVQVGGGGVNVIRTIYGASNVATATLATNLGLAHGIRRSATDLKLYRNGVEIASQALSTTVVQPGVEQYVFCRNNLGVTEQFTVASIPIGGYAIDNGTMAVGDEPAYYTAWQTLMTAFGRQV